MSTHLDRILSVLLLSAIVATPAYAVKDFREAKRIATYLHAPRGLTLYCRCHYSGKAIDMRSCGLIPARDPHRAARLEWEHVVPAEAFGQSFAEWRDGGPRCHGGRGRKCAETNAVFNRMEGDLYNLFPEDGEVNGIRSNYSMAEIGALGHFAGQSFGGCKAVIFESKFEPMDFAKGTVARAYLYMDGEYPGRGMISDKNRKLFGAWDAAHPVEPWECDLYRTIRRIQTDENPILATRCKNLPR
jgi:deoxyribonuclease-1